MMDEKFICAVNHIATQLLYRWLPSSFDFTTSSQEIFSFANLTRFDCEQIVKDVLDSSSAHLTWLSLYRHKYDHSGQALSRALYEHLHAVELAEATYIVRNDARYPQQLLQIPAPPWAFTLVGNPNALQLPRIAVVGSRKASRFALNESFAIGKALAASGICVVSGGAFGCDIAAHQGALASDVRPLPAIVVLAGGLADFYPKANEYIFRDILTSGGAIISERLWDMPSRALDFPIRNRLVAGLAPQILIMQASKKSGAMTTANLALEQGREVFVLMQENMEIFSDGGLKLLFDGALGFENARNFVEKTFVGYRLVENT